MEPPASCISGRNPTAMAFSEYALVRSAVAALSHGVSRKFPPSASCGAKAMAWRNPSRLPHRCSRSLATTAICSSSFASISSTGGGSGRRLADFSVKPMALPKLVSAI